MRLFEEALIHLSKGSLSKSPEEKNHTGMIKNAMIMTMMVVILNDQNLNDDDDDDDDGHT